MTKIIDPHVDLILVGDSVGMVLHGLETTREVTLEMMIMHGQAVMRAKPNACVVVDMPFGSYENDRSQALINAQEIMDKTGCDAVKLEGGVEIETIIRYLTDNNIPVMGHIGLQPQSIEKGGKFSVQGKQKEDVQKLLDDAAAVQNSGAFSLVIEATLALISQEITNQVTIPTIGIGASQHCDGQILVLNDILNMDPKGRKAKFVKTYADIGSSIDKAVEHYASEVKAREFPTEQYLYGTSKP